MTAGKSSSDRRQRQRREIDRGASDRRRQVRRTTVRKIVSFDVDYGADNNFLLRKAHNLSLDGIFIETEQVPPINSRVIIKIEIPGSSRKLVLNGTVQWIHSNDKRSRLEGFPPGVGIQFRDLSGADKKELDAVFRQAQN